MKSVDRDADSFTIRFSKAEASNLVSALESIEQYIDDIDPSIIKMSADEVTELRRNLVAALR